MRRHDLDLLSFVSGVLFAGLGVVFALKATGTITLDVGAVVPLVFIVIGVAILASVITSMMRSVPEPLPVPTDPVEPPEPPRL